MYRVFLAIISIMLVAAGIPAVAASQTPVTPQSPLAEKMVRFDFGDDWIVYLDENGDPSLSDFPQLLDGEAQRELVPTATEFYAEHGTINVHLYYVEFHHRSADPVSLPLFASIRIAEHANDADAQGFLDGGFDLQVKTAQGEDNPPDDDFERIEPLPDADYPIVGWTFRSSYSYPDSPEELWASSVRYMMRVGKYVVSVATTSAHPDFNFDLAYWLVQEQAACVEQAGPCAPVAVPMGQNAWVYDRRTMFYTNPESGKRVPTLYEFPIDEVRRAPVISFTLPGTND